MASEDLKFNKVNINGIQSSSVSAALSGNVKENTIENMFKAFQQFAQSRGVTIKPEDFQRIVNSHPEIFELPLEQQADAIVKLIVEESISETPDAEEQNTNAEEKVSGKTSSTFSFGTLTEEEQAQLQKVVAQTLSSEITESTNPFGATDNSDAAVQNLFNADNLEETPSTTERTEPTKTTEKTESLQAKSENNSKGISDKDREILNAILKNTYGTLTEEENHTQETTSNFPDISEITDENDLRKVFLNEYAKNVYLYGSEKHSAEDWEKLTDEEKAQFIKDNNIEKTVDTSLANTNSAFASFKIDNSTDAPFDLLRLKMLELQAANTKGLSLAEFKKLDTMSQCAVLLDVIAAKNPDELTVFEKDALELGNMLKETVVYKLSQSGALDKDSQNLDVNQMGFSQFYDIIKTSGGKSSLAVWLKEYLASKNPEEMSDIETCTYDLLKNSKEYLFQDFGTEAGLTLLETEVSIDEEYKERYEQTGDIAQKAEIKAQYFYDKYGDDPAKFMEHISDALKHGNIVEANALMQFAMNPTVDMPETKAALADYLKAGDSNVTGLTRKEGLRGLAVNYAKSLLAGVHRAQKEGIISEERAKEEAKEAVKDLEGNELVEVTNEIGEHSDAIQEGIIEGSAEAIENGKVGDKELNEIGQNIGDKASDKAQDAAIDKIVKNKKISSKRRRAFTEGFVSNSGSAAKKCVDKHVVAAFNDDPESQKAVFGAIQTSVENNVPSKNEAIRTLNKLVDQIPECNETVQADVHELITNGKYTENAVYAASNIYRYAESAQAKALAVSYATGKIEIIEAATLQVTKMAKSAVTQMRQEIAVQVAAMEERHMLSALDEYALRQLKKELGFDVDVTTPEFKSRLETYIEELKGLSRSELYQRICTDIQSWPADMQAIVLENIVKYCPQLFAMLLEKYGERLLSSFGQLNSSTRNAILMQMLKTPSKRAEAMAYIKANPNGSYSDELKQLYNEIFEVLVANGTMRADDYVAAKFNNNTTYQSVPEGLSSQTSIVNIGQKYNWSMVSDVDGNIGLVS